MKYFNNMKNTMFPEVGRRITITERTSNRWSSGLGGQCPNDAYGCDKPLEIPFTGRVIAIKESVGCTTINVDKWGFDLRHLEWEYADEPYQIY